MKNKNIFENLELNLGNKTEKNIMSKKNGVRDVDAHYDIDGVSLSNDEVVVSGDAQTTTDAPPPQKDQSKYRIQNGLAQVDAQSKRSNPA